MVACDVFTHMLYQHCSDMITLWLKDNSAFPDSLNSVVRALADCSELAFPMDVRVRVSACVNSCKYIYHQKHIVAYSKVPKVLFGKRTHSR